MSASSSALVITRPGAESIEHTTSEAELISSAQLRAWVRSGAVLHHLFRHRSVELVTPRTSALPHPLTTMTLLRALTLGSCRVIDGSGGSISVTIPRIASAALRYTIDALTRKQAVSEALSLLSKVSRRAGPSSASENLPLAYLRTDLWFGVESGGSVAHTAGVANAIKQVTGTAPVVFVTENVPGVIADQHLLPVPNRFWDFPEVPSFAANEHMILSAQSRLGGPIRAVYHRYSINSFVGAALAARLGVPFVLEYNGSETWINRHWGERLHFEQSSARIEERNLELADLIVVVSVASRNELISRGVPVEKILVNPNGVDPAVYSPAVSGSETRAARGLEGKLVIGFIGTFGPWHGAEVLADAFGALLDSRPDLRDRTRLLMIGDGPTRPESEQRLATAGVRKYADYTGRTKQLHGPHLLAAADILVSPHVPNRDGTEFFGSPTKLFEYMAMGKPIVASRLAQIADVLEDERTALLVEPGNAIDTAAALARLVDDPKLRQSLGAAAREKAVQNYTWEQHTRRILDRLALL